MSWPATMPDLAPQDFVHGDWMVLDTGGRRCWARSASPSEVDEYQAESGCGCRCCLVGWVRYSFGLPAEPGSGGPLVGEGLRFLREFVSRAGGPPLCSELEASAFFEGDDDEDYWEERLEPETAARHWAATSAHFGYTVSV